MGAYFFFSIRRDLNEGIPGIYRRERIAHVWYVAHNKFQPKAWNKFKRMQAKSKRISQKNQ